MLNTASVRISLRLACWRQAWPLERGEIAVRVALAVGARELHGVDQRGVVELVGEDRVAAPDERRHDARLAM
jgi:hypothetical protein